jgi:hypothetical protein
MMNNLEVANQNAARDYDMPVFEVARIRKLYPDRFYEKLEEFIFLRAKASN